MRSELLTSSTKTAWHGHMHDACLLSTGGTAQGPCRGSCAQSLTYVRPTKRRHERDACKPAKQKGAAVPSVGTTTAVPAIPAALSPAPVAAAWLARVPAGRARVFSTRRYCSAWSSVGAAVAASAARSAATAAAGVVLSAAGCRPPPMHAQITPHTRCAPLE